MPTKTNETGPMTIPTATAKLTIAQITDIAKVCHAANKAWCESEFDMSQNIWENAQEWQRDSAIKGVVFALENPNAPASSQHDAWSQDKLKEGWQYGEMKDAEKKIHPCLVPFENLPDFQQKKDKLFKAIVAALS